MENRFKALAGELGRAIGKARVCTDDLTRVATAADAGCYRKVPGIVLKPVDEQQVIHSLRILNRQKVPVTFRAAGTSLSGQSISDSVLMVVRGDPWSWCEVLEEGRFVRVGPGITGSRINQILARRGVKFGPDPASINSAMVGGIIANNASGMSCGTHANSYTTLQSARIIFADGTLLDTADESGRERFLQEKSELVSTIRSLKERISGNREWSDKITKKYSIKNTTGYSLNAFLNHDDPVDIILHLMAGSEGTLGFIAEATFSTIPVKPFRASALIYFPDLESACNAVPPLREAGVPAIEIMDRKALRSVEEQKGIPDYIRELGGSVAALLIDLEAENREELDVMIATTGKALEQFNLVREFEVTDDPKQIADYWNVRKGVFPSVGGMRHPGTSVIIEDVAVAPQHLTGAVTDLRRLLDELGYGEAVIYGHVLDGNLHFIFAQDFHDPPELKRYEEMIRRVTGLIVERYDGSLKAEHGTGLNMAPFVEYEWGAELYGIMKEIKSAFDPKGILNPDVIITDDPRLHLKHFKPMPEIDQAVDNCIECGFCEISCLSEGFTLSARQRIVVQREMKQLRDSGGNRRRLRSLQRSFRYEGDRTCAGDGLCSITCPLDIDTGVMIKNLRHERNRERKISRALAGWMASHFTTVHRAVETGLGAMASAARILPVRKLLIWDRHMPRPVRKSAYPPAVSGKSEMKVVYFPSCINQSMGTSVRDPVTEPLLQVTVEVLEKAGYRVIFPDGMGSLCCGTPWESKGYYELADQQSAKLEAALLKASEGGKFPVLCDTSPCTHRMKKVISSGLLLYEPVEFIHDHLLDKLPLEKIPGRMAFHITCTSIKMDLEEQFIKVAETCCTEPVFPEEVGCCGFAGDKGFTAPALNSWALRKLNREMTGVEKGFSNSRTCEIGLSRNSGIDYSSVMYLVHRSMNGIN